jgi:hypothetical protein
MLFLKRVAVWLVEQLPEAFLLGCLLAALVLRIAGQHAGLFPKGIKDSLQVVSVLGVAVATILFMHGYYATKAVFGVLFRSNRPWLYPVIAAALFVIHCHITFLRAKPDLTPEARNMELPFVVAGACIVFTCAFAGGWFLRKWTRAESLPTPYLSASAIVLLLFIMINTAHYLRPVIGDSAFRQYGLPFTFYREGGFVNGWVWRGGSIVRRGMVADLTVVLVAIAVLGTVWRRVVESDGR